MYRWTDGQTDGRRGKLRRRGEEEEARTNTRGSRMAHWTVVGRSVGRSGPNAPGSVSPRDGTLCLLH